MYTFVIEIPVQIAGLPATHWGERRVTHADGVIVVEGQGGIASDPDHLVDSFTAIPELAPQAIRVTRGEVVHGPFVLPASETPWADPYAYVMEPVEVRDGHPTDTAREGDQVDTNRLYDVIWYATKQRYSIPDPEPEPEPEEEP